jgi:hypothetical protein
MHWWGKGITTCGSEPKWADGTRCLDGVTCCACKSEAERWDSKFSHHCSKKPCWSRGAVVAAIARLPLAPIWHLQLHVNDGRNNAVMKLDEHTPKDQSRTQFH